MYGIYQFVVMLTLMITLVGGKLVVGSNTLRFAYHGATYSSRKVTTTMF